jgi:hypothetical protein
MKQFTQSITALGAALLLTLSVNAQTIFENTYVWGAFDHSAWKALTNYPTGYVIAGSKFFEPANTNLYITGFNDFSQHQWTITHPTAQHGFTTLQTQWKAFTNMGTPSNPSGFFIATTGTRNGTSHYYTMQTNKTGQRTLERFGTLPAGSQFGGAVQATNGGFIVVGGTGNGDVAIWKFNPYGELEWSKVLPISGFAWTVQPANGGGYVIGSTGATVTRVDVAGNFVWSTEINLPISPDGSAYTYTEFEEILPLTNTAQGFIMTGSAFSNSTSAVYTARVNWNGTVAWAKINDAQNTALPGTPVAWSNSPIEVSGSTYGTYEIIHTWRRGPVSAGGTLFAERMNISTGAQLQKGSLLNSIPVQEAFTVRQYLTSRVIIAGTRGGYSAAYSYATANLPYAAVAAEDRTEPTTEDPLKRLVIGGSNANPIFSTPGTSRVFQSELQVWPNPVSGLLNVGGALEAGAWVRVVNAQGQVVAERQVAEGESQVQLVLGQLAKGLYQVQMAGKAGVSAKAVVVE